AKEGLSQEDREAQLRENRLSLANQYVVQRYVANLKVTSIPSEIRGKSADDILTQMKEEEKVAVDLETKLAQEGLKDEEKSTLEKQLSESRKIARLAADWQVEVKVDETAKEGADPMLPIASALSEIGKSAVRVDVLIRHVPGDSRAMLPAFTPAVAYLGENFVGRTQNMTEFGTGREVVFSFNDVVVDDLGFTVKEFDEYKAADAGNIDAKIGRSLPVLYGQMRVLRPAKEETPVVQPEVKKEDASTTEAQPSAPADPEQGENK
ncbi:MAG: hypothetical protein HY391_05105, partial [Deltaproteobacteria bacterium]|nr:hypothetical protein [Deltaproteobacteria bacterium]